MDQAGSTFDWVVGHILVEVVTDAFGRAVDGLVDLKELGKTTEVGMPLEQFVERLVDDRVAQACELQLHEHLIVHALATERGVDLSDLSE